ncbi:Wzz/FepE/Etk N-terminal domain-containing protein [Domibacillus sp. DTU_2020_1001157_1_SI_ALB_TIR_016]|uniref:YveK family protein n=1 Tax=Domibacillus sp. DTU_2020_1001157_1_SI_ALB_TIR_016 TaxID=3077789 RepID=UPI0028E4DBB4|nr:Wzz/FepE/Etk N-terminal domain-containing protein [Domibacillus sp. DTU_2020_1001157_1_SI_ALB_TIR_016]WNS81205.1 Wzz/FepE/Etk N-terminal domain-containing protein [Domibacillus sp. DTU_2020_1001157_1_SI_ALB_TIR_016]
MDVQESKVNDFLRVIGRRWPVVVVITLLFTIGAGLVSFFVLPSEYEATSKVLVNETNPKAAAGEAAGDPATSYYKMETSFKLFETFMVIGQSPQVLDQVIHNLQLSESYSQLSEKVTISRVGESLVFEIRANDENPDQAISIVNEISKVLNQEISKIYGENQISVLQTGNESDAMSPVSPKPFLNMVVAFLAGLVLSVLIAALLEWVKKPKLVSVEAHSENNAMYSSKISTK